MRGELKTEVWSPEELVRIGWNSLVNCRWKILERKSKILERKPRTF